MPRARHARRRQQTTSNRAADAVRPDLQRPQADPRCMRLGSPRARCGAGAPRLHSLDPSWSGRPGAIGFRGVAARGVIALMFWAPLTRFGESGILLPVGLALAIWLATAARTLRPAVECLLPLAAAVLITTVSKVAFLGFGIGIAALDFTGFSGHAMFAAAIYPVLAFSLLGRARPSAVALGVAAGYALALLVAASRIAVGAHSVSEALLGFLLGALASALTLQGLAHPPRRAAPGVLLAGLAAWLMITPQAPPLLPSHSLVTRLALKLSDRQRPYTRADLHRRERLERQWQRDLGRQPVAAASDLAARLLGPASARGLTRALFLGRGRAAVGGLDHAEAGEQLDLLGAEAVRQQHLAGVGAELRAEPVHLARRRRELRHDAGHLDRRAVGQASRRAASRAPDTAGRRRCRRCCRCGRAAPRPPAASRSASRRRGSRTRRRSSRRARRRAPHARRSTRSAGPRRRRDGRCARHQPLEDAVAVGGDDHVHAVACRRRCSTARCRSGCCRCAARTSPNIAYSGSMHSIRLNTDSYSATSTTWPLPPLRERCCSAISAPITRVQRGDRIADRQVRAHRRPVRVAGDETHAAHRFADRAEAGLLAHRPGLAEARDAHQDQAGVVLGQRLVAETPLLERAGAEVLDHDVDLARQPAHDVLALGRRAGRRRSTSCCATGSRHHSEVPSCSRRHVRSGSPAPGGSTLITSAPNSASSRAANGPAINCPSSRTLMPCNAPLMLFPSGFGEVEFGAHAAMKPRG